LFTYIGPGCNTVTLDGDTSVSTPSPGVRFRYSAVIAAGAGVMRITDVRDVDGNSAGPDQALPVSLKNPAPQVVGDYCDTDHETLMFNPFTLVLL
jgi:hypothetical protein